MSTDPVQTKAEVTANWINNVTFSPVSLDEQLQYYVEHPEEGLLEE